MPETITRLFETPAQARQAAEELVRAGLPHGAISLIARQSGQDDETGMLEALVRAGFDREKAASFIPALAGGAAMIRAQVEPDRMAAACAAIDTALADVPFAKAGPHRASYEVSGKEEAKGDAATSSGQDISHERAR